MKKISILGSTGSIGTQALQVVDRCGDIEVVGLTANENIKLLEQQIRKYKPAIAAIGNEALFNILKNNVSDTATKIVCGIDGICEVASCSSAEMVVSSMMGISGLLPTVTAIKARKNIAFANKETLVTAGNLITELVKEYNVKFLPVDSEHSAIFQCLNSQKNQQFLKKIILTASGGPFFGKKYDELCEITPAQALKHPNWSMGNKITIDSATLMNKGLEIIEAKWLFDIDVNNIDVVVHRESIIHSLIQLSDNSVIGQLGLPDMKGPISYALHYPDRELINNEKTLDLSEIASLTFGKPDEKTFKCLALAKQAIKTGGTAPAFLNGANETAVAEFLNSKIKFTEIGEVIEQVMKDYTPINNYCLEDVLMTDRLARQHVKDILGGK